MSVQSPKRRAPNQDAAARGARRLPPTPWLIAGALGLACGVAAILIAVSLLGSDGEDRTRPAIYETAGTKLLAGIPQSSTLLGRPTAPVTLVEYADLQCPFCREFATETVPVLVREYVRTGKVR